MLRKQEYHNNLETSFNVEGRQRLASTMLAILKCPYEGRQQLQIYQKSSHVLLPENQYDRVQFTCLDFLMVFIFL